MESDIGLTPNNDGHLIRMAIPELNEERRRELVKVVRHIAEEGRVAIRNIRRDVMHDLRELKDVGRRRRRRRAPRRGRAAEAHRRAHRRARDGAEGQGSRDPRGLMASDGRAARYVAIITDGNGRWAQQRGLPVVEGHQAGADVVKARLRDAVEFGMRELTVYSFSTENWSRPAEEVTALMRMFSQRIATETPELNEEGVRMRFIGRRERVTPALLEQMDWAEARDGGQRPHHALRRLQLRRPRGDPRRGGALQRRGRGGVPARCSTPPRCTTPTSSSARAASSGCATTCCGSRPTPSSSSPTSCGPTSRARRSGRALDEFERRRRRFGGR